MHVAEILGAMACRHHSDDVFDYFLKAEDDLSEKVGSPPSLAGIFGFADLHDILRRVFFPGAFRNSARLAWGSGQNSTHVSPNGSMCSLLNEVREGMRMLFRVESREAHARFRGGLRVRLPGPTRPDWPVFK
jgi:hypothetical protein